VPVPLDLGEEIDQQGLPVRIAPLALDQVELDRDPGHQPRFARLSPQQHPAQRRRGRRYRGPMFE